MGLNNILSAIFRSLYFCFVCFTLKIKNVIIVLEVEYEKVDCCFRE